MGRAGAFGPLDSAAGQFARMKSAARTNDSGAYRRLYREVAPRVGTGPP